MLLFKDRKDPGITSEACLYLGAFIIFLSLRLISWSNGPLLEASDAIGLMATIKHFLALEFQTLIDSSPDYTPFYPAFGALFSAIAGSVENGARLCSLFFSCIVFVCVIGMGRKVATPLEITLGLILLAISPFLLRFSFSVLTEPPYVATIYAGFWLFWSKLKTPKWGYGIALGAIFALGFLNRMEGILYLAAMPLLQLIHYYVTGKKEYSGRQLSTWVFTFVVTFCLLSAPQVWRVTEQMGSFSLNGRQTWSLVLSSTDTRSYEQKVYGLDHSPGQINLHYLKEHPESRELLVSDVGLTQYVLSYAKLVLQNLKDLHNWALKTLIGPYGLLFFLLGLIALGARQYYFEVFLIGSFLGIGLAAPLLHNVDVRHIAIIGPLMILLQGVGIVFLAERVVRFFEVRFITREVVAAVILLTLLILNAKPLYKVLRVPGGSYSTYNASDLAEPTALIARVSSEQLRRPANLISRKGYLPFYSESNGVPLPYTDYAGLVEYARLNSADFLFLDQGRVRKHPYYEEFFRREVTPDFKLLYKGKNRWGRELRLYRFIPSS
jgi:Dolichyl-phosphate-mannose-protein mannosyltransferase